MTALGGARRAADPFWCDAPSPQADRLLIAAPADRRQSDFDLKPAMGYKKQPFYTV